MWPKVLFFSFHSPPHGHVSTAVDLCILACFRPFSAIWWSFLIIFEKYFLRGLTSESRREASNESIFDRLDIFPDAMNLKNTLVLLFRSSDRPQVAYQKSTLFFNRTADPETKFKNLLSPTRAGRAASPAAGSLKLQFPRSEFVCVVSRE